MIEIAMGSLSGGVVLYRIRKEDIAPIGVIAKNITPTIFRNSLRLDRRKAVYVKMGNGGVVVHYNCASTVFKSDGTAVRDQWIEFRFSDNVTERLRAYMTFLYAPGSLVKATAVSGSRFTVFIDGGVTVYQWLDVVMKRSSDVIDSVNAGGHYMGLSNVP